MNSKNFKGQSLNGVSIARSSRYWHGRTYPKLFPTWEMIKMEDEQEYEATYRKSVLSKLDAREVYEELGENAILLCHEKYADIESGKTFCHRTMVAKWLQEELGVEVVELKDVKEEMKQELKKAKELEQYSLFDDDSVWDDDEDWDS